MLLVEDNQLSQKMMFYTLRHVGLKADVADDGRKAVEMATSNPYDIILMDIMMPELNGYEATHFIRQFEHENKSKKAFIIGLTGNVYDSGGQSASMPAWTSFSPNLSTSISF